MSLDEWVEKCCPQLKKNLEANLSSLCPDMSEEDREALIRCDLLMIRDWALDWGIQ